MSLISFNNVSKTYSSGVEAVRNINLTINHGEFVFFVGSSGSGKSTMIRLLLKEIDPSIGEICVNNDELNNLSRKEIPFYRRGLGVVFQDFRLLPNRTVYDNVAFAMRVINANKKDVRRNVPLTLSLVGLQHKAKSYPDELSGGEQQRVSLARALVNNPPILLADEPTGNLDPHTAWEIMTLLENINKSGTTVVVSTHAKELVDRMQKRVITLKDGELASDAVGGYNESVSPDEGVLI